MAIKQNYVIGQGETFTLRLTLLDASGNPVDLTGHAVTLHLKNRDSDSVIGEYATVVDAEGGVEIKVEDEVTATWPAGNNKYIIIHDQPNGDRQYWAYGNLTVMDVV